MENQEKFTSTWYGPDGSKLVIETTLEPSIEYLKDLLERIVKTLNDPDGIVYAAKEYYGT